MRTVRVNIDIGLSDLENAINRSGLYGVLEWANAAVAAVPEEFRDKAAVSCTCDYDSCWGFELSYERPETDEDRQKKDAEQQMWRERLGSEEYATYLRLKKKFETPQ
jgi:hypothetical protein